MKLILIKVNELYYAFHSDKPIERLTVQDQVFPIDFDDYEGKNLTEIYNLMIANGIPDYAKLRVESHSSGLQEFYFVTERPRTNAELLVQLQIPNPTKSKKNTYKADNHLVTVEVIPLPASDIYKELLTELNKDDKFLFGSDDKVLVTNGLINKNKLKNFFKKYNLTLSDVQFIHKEYVKE